MGPKKTDSGASKKTEIKKKEKIIEDKTFGLKNKNKSKAVQNYIKGIENTVKGNKGSHEQQISQEFEEKALKKKLKEEEAFLNSLSKAVKTITQEEVSDDEEKKYVLCQFFKNQGFCEDGDNCKFSHDLNIEYNVRSLLFLLLLLNFFIHKIYFSKERLIFTLTYEKPNPN